MSNQILDALGGSTAFPMTGSTTNFASLANNTAVQVDMVANASPARTRALVHVKMKSNGTPTAGSIYGVYLIRGDGHGTPHRTDGAAATSQAITIKAATLIGTLPNAGTSGEVCQGTFDTAPAGPLGVEWGIAVLNLTGQSTTATAGDHWARYTYVTAEIQ